MTKMTLKKADAIIRTAKLDGFGGNCGRVAIAINHVLFGGKGRYVVATNPPLNAKTGDYFMGHVAVEWKKRLFDATGLITNEEDFEAWGMLDPADPDLPARLTEAEAEQGELHYIDDEFGDQRGQEDAIENFTSGHCSLRDAWKVLEHAREAVK